MALTILFAACGDIRTDRVEVAPVPTPAPPAGATLPAALSPALGPPLAWHLELTRQSHETWWWAIQARKPRAVPRSRLPASNHIRGTTRAESGSGACGGDLPSCSILACESGGNLRARNPSGAAGKWQIMPGTWGGYGGYSSADQAPESVQDERARQIWAGGRGRSQWVC